MVGWEVCIILWGGEEEEEVVVVVVEVWEVGLVPLPLAVPSWTVLWGEEE